MSFTKLLFFSSQAYTSCDGRPDYGIVYSAQIFVVMHKGNNSGTYHPQLLHVLPVLLLLLNRGFCFKKIDLKGEGRRSPEQLPHLLSSENHFRRDPRKDVCGWMGHSITRERLLKARVCWVQGKRASRSWDSTQTQAHIDDLRYIRDLGGVAEHTLLASALQCVLTLSMRWVETLYIPP